MKNLILFLYFILASTILNAEDGLYIPHNEEPKLELNNGDLIYRFKTSRLEIVNATLRYDTEDKTKYWLEFDIKRNEKLPNADPGDDYLFVMGGKEYKGFTIGRGPVLNENRRWNILVDIDVGRKLLREIGIAYKLPATAVVDKTVVGE